MKIAKAWNREPDWWYTLDKATQIRVIADYNMDNESPKERKAAEELLKRREFTKRLHKERNKDRINGG
jgi:hypothetical protein